MKEFIDALAAHKKWKNSVRNVLEKNYDGIAALLADAYGENTFIPMQLGTSLEPVTGALINRHIHKKSYIIWYYKFGRYYMLEQEKRTLSMGTRPFLYGLQPIGINSNPSDFQLFVSDANEESSFVVDFYNKLDETLDKIKEKRDSLSTEDLANATEAAIKETDAKFREINI